MAALGRLHATLAVAADRGHRLPSSPKSFTARLVDSKILRAALAHGGKDGHPFPVPLKVYDETIAVNARWATPSWAAASSLLRSSALTIKRASSNELLGPNNLRGHRWQKSSPQSGGNRQVTAAERSTLDPESAALR
jgi:hypothetical protein